MTEREQTGVELLLSELLSEPEIAAWLEPHEHPCDDDDDRSRGQATHPCTPEF